MVLEQEVIAEAAAFIQGCEYPCTRQELIDTAEVEGAPEEVVEFIGQLPDGEYLSETLVIEALEGCRC